MFQIGQKVICIDDSMNPETVDYTPCRPRKGEVYTVRGFLTEGLSTVANFTDRPEGAVRPL